jgi:hypothetical protein
MPFPNALFFENVSVGYEGALVFKNVVLNAVVLNANNSDMDNAHQKLVRREKCESLKVRKCH